MDKKSIWNYFKRTLIKDAAICKQCLRQIKTAGGSTSGLHSHLKSQHKINLLKRDNEEMTDDPTKSVLTKANSQLKITSFYDNKIDESLSAVISRMIARDGIPFMKFCVSDDLRMLLNAKGYTNIPKSSITIQKLVMNYADKIKQEVVNEILHHKAYSLTTDEWTSNRNRRYMNFCLHGNNGKFWNLGLSRIFGSAPAEVLAELIVNKLKDFNLSLANIVCITSDAAAVMKKTMRLINKDHQLCLAHGLQLAVMKILYNTRHEQFEQQCDANVISTEKTNSEISDMENEDSVETDDGTFEIHHKEVLFDTELVLQNVELYYLITKIRKVVRLFRKSPTRNDDVLQRYVKEITGRELSLILDCKTRWNSLLIMLERFLLLRDAVRKSLIDLKSDIFFTDNDLKLLSNVILALQPIKLAVETLCSENVNLYVADVTLKFMLDELSSQNTFFSIQLKNALIFSIKERRTSFSDVLHYLTDSNLNISEEENYGIFNLSSKATIIKTIAYMVKSISCNTTDSGSCADLSDSELDNEIKPKFNTNPELSMKEKLNMLIKQKTEVTQEKLFVEEKEIKQLKVVVKNELDYFRQENVRGKYIQMVFDYLMTIRPTSVEPERIFSGVGLFCTKIRSSLGDKTLDKLSFLRTYFLKNVNNDNKCL